MIAFVQIPLTLSVVCVCVCMAEEKGQIHWAVATEIKHQVDHVEIKSSDEIDSVESILTEGERGRRSLSQSDRINSLTLINNLRRTVGASNMPYLSYDDRGESDAASWTIVCNFDRLFTVPGYANGFQHIISGSMSIENVIKDMYKTFSKAMSSVYLTSFGCDLRKCNSAYYKGVNYVDVQLTLCLVKGGSQYDNTEVQYKLGEGCTECNSGSFWCDYGLCRVDCSSSDSCYCNSYCQNCADTNNATCRCQCLQGWTGSRCETPGAGAVTPTCLTTPRVPKTITTISSNSMASTGVPVLQLVFCAALYQILNYD